MAGQLRWRAMKRVPHFNQVCRAAGISAVAFLSVGLGLATANAQNSQAMPPSQSPTTPDNANNSPVTPSDARDGTDPTMSHATATSKANADSLGWSDRHFLHKAAKGSEEEVTLAQLAEQRSNNTQVKQLAQELISDHEKMNRSLHDLAQQKGVKLPSLSAADMGEGNGSNGMATPGRGAGNYAQEGTTASPGASGATTGGTEMSGSEANSTRATGSTMNSMANSRAYSELAKKSGADFDHAYLKKVVAAHQKDVKLFKKEAKRAKDPDVRSFASDQVPTLQSHLNHAQRIVQSAAE